jgi:hypothetical protein
MAARAAWKGEEENNAASIMKCYKLQCQNLQRREGKSIMMNYRHNQRNCYSKLLTKPQTFCLQDKETVSMKRWILSKGHSSRYV